jgi:hypothetical protein
MHRVDGLAFDSSILCSLSRPAFIIGMTLATGVHRLNAMILLTDLKLHNKRDYLVL